MSRLLERIARRRRATASSRLGPRTHHAGTLTPAPSTNGTASADELAPAPEPIRQPDLIPEPELIHKPDLIPEPIPEPEREPEPDWVEDEDQWVELPHLTEPDEQPPEAEQEPPPAPRAVLPPVRSGPASRTQQRLGSAERGEMRRRVRYLRGLREVQLRDLGGFVLELHRFGRDRPDLVAAKLRAAAGTDDELRSLELALDGHASVRELREAGIGGACMECGAVHGSGDRFCASCGGPLGVDLGEQHR
jgi:hypothetical protein